MPKDYAKHHHRSYHRNPPPKNGPSGFTLLLLGILIGLIIAGIFYLNQNKRHPAPATHDIPAKPISAKAVSKQSSTDNLQTQFDFYDVLPSNKVVGPRGDEDTSQINKQDTSPETNNPSSDADKQVSSSPLPASSLQTQKESIKNSAKLEMPQPASSKTENSSVISQLKNILHSSAKTKPTEEKAEHSSTDNIKSDLHNTISHERISTRNTFIVQIAALGATAKADQLKAQLSLAGFEVHISPVSKGKITLQRIWMGPYQTQDEALAMQQKLQQNQIASKVLKTST